MLQDANRTALPCERPTPFGAGLSPDRDRPGLTRRGQLHFGQDAHLVGQPHHWPVIFGLRQNQLSSMKQITLKVKESKLNFFLELIRALDFVKVEDLGDDDEVVRTNIRKGAEEVRRIKAGKLEGRPARELLDEL
jgi:hypothetical protein